MLCFLAAIAALKEREPGTFLIRDSNSFQGAYGLALKVATPPPNANNHNSKGKKGLRHLKVKYLHSLLYSPLHRLARLFDITFDVAAALSVGRQ